MHGDGPVCTKPIAIMTWQISNSHFHSSVSATIHAPDQTSNFALVNPCLLRRLDEHLSPSSAVKMCPAHVNQHQNDRLIPLNLLYHFIGELILLRKSNNFAERSGFENDPSA